MMYLAVNEMGLRVSPSECRLEPDRLSSCLNLMACVITRARLDSIAVVVPESVHNQRGAIPQKPKAPAYDLLSRVQYAQQPRSTFSVGAPESIVQHASQLHDGLQASLRRIKQHTIYSKFAFSRLHREVIVQSPTSTATKLTWRDSAARFRAEKNQPLTRHDTVARVLTVR